MIFESEITYIEGTPYSFEYKIFNEDGNLININYDNKDFLKFEILHKGKNYMEYSYCLKSFSNKYSRTIWWIL